jgi:hypothetical protein
MKKFLFDITAYGKEVDLVLEREILTSQKIVKLINFLYPKDSLIIFLPLNFLLSK